MPGKEYDAALAVQMTEIDGTARSVIAATEEARHAWLAPGPSQGGNRPA